MVHTNTCLEGYADIKSDLVSHDMNQIVCLIITCSNVIISKCMLVLPRQIVLLCCRKYDQQNTDTISVLLNSKWVTGFAKIFWVGYHDQSERKSLLTHFETNDKSKEDLEFEETLTIITPTRKIDKNAPLKSLTIDKCNCLRFSHLFKVCKRLGRDSKKICEKKSEWQRGCSYLPTTGKMNDVTFGKGVFMTRHLLWHQTNRKHYQNWQLTLETFAVSSRMLDPSPILRHTPSFFKWYHQWR